MRYTIAIHIGFFETGRVRSAAKNLINQKRQINNVGVGAVIVEIPSFQYAAAATQIDVVGKGVPAALLMANTQAVLRSQLRQGQAMDFSFLASNLNHLVCEFTGPGQFITGLFGSFNAKTRTFKFISAGHPMPIVAHNGQILPSSLESDIVFGVLPDYQFRQHSISLPEQSLMLLYTDGLSEAENEKGEQFGEEKTALHLTEFGSCSAKGVCDGFLKKVSEFVGQAPQSDDLT